MLVSKIVGSDGKALKVLDEGALGVVVHQHPPLVEDVHTLPFRSYFTDDGTPTGTNAMRVDGSLNYVDFYIKASPDYDIYIKYISAEIGDGGSPALNKFGDLPALPNGVSFYWDTQEEPEYELHEGFKTNKSMIRIFSDTFAVGTGVDAFLSDVSGNATEKSYLLGLDMEEVYALKWGLRLRKGTTDKIIFRVRDDLTGLTTFNAIGTGPRI